MIEGAVNHAVGGGSPTAQTRLAEIKHIGEGARDYISVAKQWALRHIECRLEAEVTHLAALLSAAPDLVSDERDPRPRKSKAH